MTSPDARPAFRSDPPWYLAEPSFRGSSCRQSAGSAWVESGRDAQHPRFVAGGEVGNFDILRNTVGQRPWRVLPRVYDTTGEGSYDVEASPEA